MSAATVRDASRVAGEAVPWVVGAGLSAIGLACAMGVAARIGPIGATTPAAAMIAPAIETPTLAATAPGARVVEDPVMAVKPASAPAEPGAGGDAGAVAPKATATADDGARNAAPEDARVGCPAPVVAWFPIAGVEPRVLPRAELGHLAAWLGTHPETRVEARGYCDARGDATVNRTIGRRRARALAEALGALGVPPARIEIKSIGAHGFASVKNTLAAANRRAEVRVVGTECGQERSASEKRAW